MNKLIEQVVVYCKKMCGQDMALRAMDKVQLGKLPIAITGNYTCYEAVLMDVPVLLLVVQNNSYTPKLLQKHQQMVARLTGHHTVFAMENVASYHVSRMIEARVNFIIPDKMIYIPSLLVNLKEMKDGRELEEEVMPAMAQCVILYHLQHESLNGYTTRQLADKFRTSYASMNRALRWLNMKGLVDLEGIKEKALVITDKGKELWEKVSPLMLSPVDRVAYTDHELVEKPFSGESALERYTMIAAPDKLCKAVSKEWALEHKQLLNKYYGDYQVEVWRYDPCLLDKNHAVDPLSLYVSLQTSDDERIRIELKNLINSITWLED